MKKLSFLAFGAVFVFASCSQPAASNVATNIQTNSAVNQPTSSNKRTEILQNKNTISETNSKVDAQMLKQIEDQQRETADPRSAANKTVTTNTNQSPEINSNTSTSQN